MKKLKEKFVDLKERVMDLDESVIHNYTEIRSLKDERKTQRQVNYFAFVIAIIALLIHFLK